MQPSPTDDAFIVEAIRVARDSDHDDIPIGAVVVHNGQVIARAANHRTQGTDPTAHAEVSALRAAGAELGTSRLDGCDLYVTLEPCPMCAGAAVAARVRRIVFGAWNDRYGACGSVFDIPRDRHMTHRPEVVGGIREADCGELVRAFLTHRR